CARGGYGSTFDYW
nr:immunoglobulin heavy chain junction region [Mus musculus]MBK4184715.1 immunoglobulin heavy chain junction region [Mus musculus]MBK4184716.1 immunoglobulin heavy chain junction region [Mus musculus]